MIKGSIPHDDNIEHTVMQQKHHVFEENPPKELPLLKPSKPKETCEEE